MKSRYLALAAVGLMLPVLACGGSSNSNAGAPATVARTPSGPQTPVATTLLGTRPPGSTPRATPASTAMPTPPPGASAAQSLPDGLQYQDFVVGTGAQPQTGQQVTVRYTGWLDNGTKFDSSADHQPNVPGKPQGTFTFTIGTGAVIKGWDEGVATMKVGGKRRLIVPPSLGYGNNQTGSIPPNSRLTFDVELVSIG